jgi:hypothetical protein
MIFSRKFFDKIDAWISYLGDASAKNHLPLRGGLGNKMRHLYSELEVMKACGKGGGISLSRRHLIAETTSRVRSVKKEQEQSGPLQLIVNNKPLLFSAESCAAHCLYI